MQTLIIDAIERFGYIGIMLLITLENVFPPIPSEVVLSFAGFMTKHSRLETVPVIIAATVGSVLGAAILYWVGRLLSTERLERLVSGRLGRLLRFEPSDVRKAEGWFVKHGSVAVFFCRFVPIIRSLISIPAGTTKMRFGHFLLLTTAGTAIWNVVLVLLGRMAGHAWTQVAHYVDSYALIALVVLAGAFVIGAVIFYKKRARRDD